MQVESFNAVSQNVGPLPILAACWQRLELRALLGRALSAGYVRALELLLQSILLRPSALYRLGQWSELWPVISYAPRSGGLSLVRANPAFDTKTRGQGCPRFLDSRACSFC